MKHYQETVTKSSVDNWLRGLNKTDLMKLRRTIESCDKTQLRTVTAEQLKFTLEELTYIANYLMIPKFMSEQVCRRYTKSEWLEIFNKHETREDIAMDLNISLHSLRQIATKLGLEGRVKKKGMR